MRVITEYHRSLKHVLTLGTNPFRGSYLCQTNLLNCPKNFISITNSPEHQGRVPLVPVQYMRKQLTVTVSDTFLFVWQYAAAAAAFSSSSSPLVLCPQYPLGLAALAAVHQDRLYSKNSSIADLRFKAKKHAEAIQMSSEKIWDKPSLRKLPPTVISLL